ncbi:MAG: hypothetical protein WC390_11275 [Sulfurimonas sp.]|jgi:hypothetical protein
MSGSLESIPKRRISTLSRIRRDRRKNIAIVGKAPSSLGLAPYGDKSWQIWTLSDLVLCKQSPRYDVQFELHKIDQITGPRQPFRDWLGRVEKPLFVREATPDLPNATPYPKDMIVAKYGHYFTNTVSWMIALAIEMKPERIGVWGVDMACNDEYGHQRPSCEYFLGMARGLGIEVVIPPQADLLKTSGLYGFDTWQSDMFVKWKARCAELSQRSTQRALERDNLDQQVAFCNGVLSVCGDDIKEEWKTRLTENERERDKAASESLYLQGALEDTRDYWGQWAQRT